MFIRTLPPSSKMINPLLSIFKKFKWKKLILIIVQNETYLRMESEFIEKSKKLNLTITNKIYLNPSFNQFEMNNKIQQLISETHHLTRIYVLFTGTSISIQLTKQLYFKQPKIFNEFLLISLIYDEIYSSFDEQNKFNDLILKELKDYNFNGTPIYDALTIITPYASVNLNYNDFLKQILEKSTNSKPSRYDALAYDSVLIYANALNKTLSNNGSSTDSQQIINYILNQTYESKFGFCDHIDLNGDADGNYSVLIFKKNSKRIKLIQIDSENQPYFNNLQQVARFRRLKESDFFKILIDEEAGDWNLKIYNIQDEPKCGFNGENCRTQIYLVIFAFAFSLFIIFMIFFWFLIKFLKDHEEIEAKHWKINLNDVHILDVDKNQDKLEVIKAIKVKFLFFSNYFKIIFKLVIFKSNLI